MGLEFVRLFDEWADSYDHSVTGHDLEYRAVFAGYHKILQAVADRVSGNIVEFGVGTGNLTEKLLKQQNQVIGFEPSSAMREKAFEKIPNARIRNGDFLNFKLDGSCDAIVSTYAFHHLTDQEKAEAFSKYSLLLNKGGKIVFADTVFLNEQHKLAVIDKAIKHDFFNLAEDLRTEYYSTIPALTAMLHANDFSVEFIQLNSFVWLMDATKLS
ncbi:class I SAM-dependent methyltransferase [Bacillus sp. DNRA2]|uniref:class I SAM-dependent DNA methyltransferase n=1 Tax=Bacillus sp. DNRA2 TaxID=2723053 RepID=UPI00145DC7DA|nr:class I SAM-dependent methyltransferase [Bacillus sp. DNRA2]NMD71732.1 class I SAM-dependent methyltransferase [Bacillus sp. DNRA2]